MWKGYGGSPEVSDDAGLVQECEGFFFWVLTSFGRFSKASTDLIRSCSLMSLLLAEEARLKIDPPGRSCFPWVGRRPMSNSNLVFLCSQRRIPREIPPNAPGVLRGINPAGGGVAARQKRETVPLRQACDCRGSSFSFF